MRGVGDGAGRLPREVYVLTAVAFAVAVGFGVVAPAIPVFAKAFDVSNTAAGAVVSAFALMRFVSDFREAMWGLAQTVLSDLDVDYAAYADEHFARLRERAADPRLEGWLARAAAA